MEPLSFPSKYPPSTCVQQGGITATLQQHCTDSSATILSCSSHAHQEITCYFSLLFFVSKACARSTKHSSRCTSPSPTSVLATSYGGTTGAQLGLTESELDSNSLIQLHSKGLLVRIVAAPDHLHQFHTVNPLPIKEHTLCCAPIHLYRGHTSLCICVEGRRAMCCKL
jgi:hypothetical protein